MLVISWNVAGLAPLIERIDQNYNPYGNDGKKRKDLPKSAALHEFMRRHGADILCLQEHKIPRKDLAELNEPYGCSRVEGFESFWSCCVDKNNKGFNGVVTYVRKGMVQSANASPLGSPELDEQGRCVMTDHGSFVLFNVYVPAGGGQPLSYKMKFLRALRRAMQEQRKQKPVILVGDLNIKHTVLDRPWKDRVVYVHNILEQVGSAPNVDDFPSWKRQLAQSWPSIVAVLATKKIVPQKTTNTKTGEQYDKFKLVVTVNNRQVQLGNYESSKGSCTYYYDFDADEYEDSETGEMCMCREANVVTVGVLIELMAKIAGIKWDDSTQRLISKEEGCIRRIDPPRQWLDSIIEEDGMVDTFRHFYTSAEGRFTCWGQSKNQRYVNSGVRLDYMLVDKCLLPHVLKGDVPSLRCGGADIDDPLGEHAALCAATASGQFQPAPYEGGGVPEVSQTALDTQFGPPHTGIIYTPPLFSDHIGVSLLMNDECCERALVLNKRESDSALRKSQPHKEQRSIIGYCSETTGEKPKRTQSAQEKLKAAAKKPKPNQINYHFSGAQNVKNGRKSSDSQRNGTSKRPKLGSSNGKGQKSKSSKANGKTKQSTLFGYSYVERK